MTAHEVASLVPTPRLLESLGFVVNERSMRCSCAIHGGSNSSAFSWTYAGLWRCHSCGAGGDKISLVRAMRGCGFREAVTYLAGLAGVEFQNRSLSRADFAQMRLRRERAERAAWRVSDSVHELRRYYLSAMLRAERLGWRIGKHLRHTLVLEEQAACWDALARLAPAQTFFLAVWNFIWDAKADTLVRFVLATPFKRRGAILEGNEI